MADTKIEALRTKISIQLDQLDEMLDDAGHDKVCVLRCLSPEFCRDDHHCEVCGDDE